SAPGYSQYMPDPSRKTRPLPRMSLRWAHTCRRRSPAACSLKYRAKSIRVYLSFARSPCPILLNALARIWSLRALLPSLVSITSFGLAGALGAASVEFVSTTEPFTSTVGLVVLVVLTRTSAPCLLLSTKRESLRTLLVVGKTSVVGVTGDGLDSRASPVTGWIAAAGVTPSAVTGSIDP